MTSPQAEPAARRQDERIFATDYEAVRRLERKAGYLMAIAVIFAVIGAYIVVATVLHFIFQGRFSPLMFGLGAAAFYPLSQYGRLRKLLPAIKHEAAAPALAQARRHLRRGFLFAGIAAGLFLLIIAGVFIFIISLGGFHR